MELRFRSALRSKVWRAKQQAETIEVLKADLSSRSRCPRAALSPMKKGQKPDEGVPRASDLAVISAGTDRKRFPRRFEPSVPLLSAVHA